MPKSYTFRDFDGYQGRTWVDRKRLICFTEVTCQIYEIRVHVSFALDEYDIPEGGLDVGLAQILRCLGRTLDISHLAQTLHPRGNIHRIAPNVV